MRGRKLDLHYRGCESLLHLGSALYLKSIATVRLRLLLPAWPGSRIKLPPKAGPQRLSAGSRNPDNTPPALARQKGICEWETLSFPPYLPVFILF